MEMEKITTEKERKKEDEGKSEPKAESKPEGTRNLSNSSTT